MKKIYVKDIKAGDKVTDTFLAVEKNLAFSQKGSPYLNVRLRDRTGDIEGRVWERATDINKLFKKGDVVQVNSRAASYKSALQLSILDIRKTDGEEVDLRDYAPVSRFAVEDMLGELFHYIEGVKNPHLRGLLDAFFQDEHVVERFKLAPAAKGFHHVYLGGLLEHTVSVLKLLDLVSTHYDNLDRDLLIAGGILHDIGKIAELSSGPVFEYTDTGRLIGHIVLGVEMLDAKVATLDNFPEQLAMELRHIILSHHGILEYGSPKRPKTLEALVIHYIDDLDAKVNAFQGFIDNADEDSDWTPFHRLFERFIYKGKQQNEG
ncbi:MAG: HD domain-containing protein [Syntrophobacterales bacterium]|nr:HD domain-containing protein [Syntrophobacterales bacterium]